MKYDRIVKAALAETGTKKGIAEALALDIPPQQGKPGVAEKLAAAAEAIIDAGGEPKSPYTLSEYRSAALHFMVETQEVVWADASLTSHIEAWHAGIPAADFRAHPKTSREIRVENNKKLPGAGPVEAVVKGWSAEEKQAVARALVHDEDAQVAIIDVVSDSHGLAAQVDEEYDRKNARKQPVKSPGAVVSLMEIDVHTGLCDELVKEGKVVPSALLGIAGAVEPGTPIHTLLTLYRSALQRAQKTVDDLEPLVAAMLGDGPKTAEQALAEWSNS